MLVTSRSLAEYRAFFDLSDADLGGRVLDCSAGASGFAAAVNADGGRVTALDPAYKDPAVLREEIERSVEGGASLIDANTERFAWSWYGSPERRQELRDEARAAFLRDLVEHPATYIPGGLPALPFPDDAFDLALCSHLLFTWASDELDEEWHHAALTDLLRVAPQVRVFPLVLQGDGSPVPFLPRLLDRLRAEGRTAEVRPVPYEFQRGADEMLVLRRG